jgi:dolichyl-diphosphooligosaccharide--protein glycosyltransferase
MPWPQEYGLATMLLTLLGLVYYSRHSQWVTSEAYSSPSIVLISGQGANRYVLDDFR